ncbi:hypothetical protein CAEBREN_31011, partial [Caenorhabditis brenneri]
MQKALGTTATFGEDKKVTNISDMKGFMSRIALIEPCWIGFTNEETLPEKFIVKISSQLPYIEMTKLMDFGGEDIWNAEKLKTMGEATRVFHNKEVATYQIMMRENHPKLPLTKIYAVKPFDEENSLKAYIISEYIPNLYHIGMHDSIPAEDLLPIVQALATFSAIGQKLSEEETKYARGANFLDMIFHQFMDETSIKRSETMMRNAFPEEYHEKVEQMSKNNQDYYLNPKMLNNFKNTCNFFGYQPVLTHSDAWSANFLCTKEGSKVNFKALIDFQ